MSIKTTAKIVGHFSRKIDHFFFVLLYREIIMKVCQEFEDPLPILRRFGSTAAETSCDKHRTLLKLVKTNPDKVADTISLVWYITFGQEIEFENEIIDYKEKNVQSVIIKIKKCPLCSELNRNEYFNMIPLEKFKSSQDGYACVLCAMLEGATNYIMSVHKQPYKIKAIEAGCQLYGKSSFELKIELYKTS